MAHGLAGSAALLLIVLSSAHSVSEGLLYRGVRVGSIMGMVWLIRPSGLEFGPSVWSLSAWPASCFYAVPGSGQFTGQ